jgi:hypothetical protein
MSDGTVPARSVAKPGSSEVGLGLARSRGGFRRGDESRL